MKVNMYTYTYIHAHHHTFMLCISALSFTMKLQ